MHPILSPSAPSGHLIGPPPQSPCCDLPLSIVISFKSSFGGFLIWDPRGSTSTTNHSTAFRNYSATLLLRASIISISLMPSSCLFSSYVYVSRDVSFLNAFNRYQHAYHQYYDFLYYWSNLNVLLYFFFYL
jgi:hypothetical protein